MWKVNDNICETVFNTWKKIRKAFYICGGLVMLFCVVFGKLIHDKYTEYVLNHPLMYCYDEFRKLSFPVPVLIIDDLKYKRGYLKYYAQLETGIEPILDDDVPLKGLPTSNPVYVLGYTEDSVLAKIVSYDDGMVGGLFTKGWVYAKCLHANPPLLEGKRQ